MRSNVFIRRTILVTLLLSTLHPQFTKIFAQGTLTPPGPPAPTMKTLDQIEARIPISATTTPGDGADSFIITNSGSYYLTTNFVASSTRHGIRIATNNVTIDLNGFGLDGAGTGGIGIRILTNIRRQNITIRNGFIRDWTLSGIDLTFGINTLIEKVCASANGGNGIATGESSIVRDCLAYTNASSGTIVAGISAGQSSVVEGCTADFNANINGNNFGFALGAGSTISHCSANQNNGPGAIGIDLSVDCVAVDCTVAFQTGANCIGIAAFPGCSVTHCSASGISGTGSIGIFATQRARIENCTAMNNGGDGIKASDNCFIVSNTCGSNGGAGIHTTGQRNRVDGNDASLNATAGIQIDSNLNLVIRNSASGTSISNYVVTAGNNDAERIGGGTAFVGTDPWANFSY